MSFSKRAMGGRGYSGQKSVSDGLTMDLFGDEELNKFFHETLKWSQQKSVFLSAYRKAAKPLVRTARQNLRSRRKSPHNPKGLYASIGVKPGRSRKPVLLAGARTFGNWKGNAGHLVDTGTGSIRSTKKGKSTGKMPGNHFWTDALKTEERTVKHLMSDELMLSLKKLVDRNLKKMNA